ncbi:MAG: hypothetical protein SVX43_16215 [Cyanobacteriota bacterium]|nr:hypothetical protein [Cyanobacteriota bacterium]
MKIQRLWQRTCIFVLTLILLAFSINSPPEALAASLPSTTAKISATNGKPKISLSLLQPEQYLEPDGKLLVSVEVPKKVSDLPVKAIAFPFISRPQAIGQMLAVGSEVRPVNDARRFADPDAIAPVLLKPIEFPVRSLGVTFPPGPDNETTWKTFVLELSQNPKLLQGPIQLALFPKLRGSLTFTRILIGKPSTPRSTILGAFSPSSPIRPTLTPTIRAGVDYLGTIAAKQHIRIPANTLAPNTEAFDEMVVFGDAPFDPKHSNVDTVMVRSRDVSVGGTTPVRLIRFANKTKQPIAIKSNAGELYYEILARLSPNAKSEGFITILPDGTYKSTTSLYPVLEFQQVTKEGKALGDPISVDTALTPIPGFPFYLSSQGGKWATRPPQNRLVTAMSSNFYYNNGEANAFIHSNGLGVGVTSGCSKASPVSF